VLLSIQITTELPIWFTLFCVLLGLAYAYLLYRKEERFTELPKWKIGLMASFRWVLVTILAFLLLTPFIKTVFNKVEKPIIIIAQDNSSSILLNKDSAYYQTKYLQEIKKLQEDLKEDYEVRTFTFGGKVKEEGEIDYNQKITDIAHVFDEINNKFYNKNVGALILASDGIFNQGANPVFSTSVTNFPIYTIALGDTTTPKDILLKDVIHNKITFLGNQFPIEIYAETQQLKGEKTKLMVTNNGKLLFAKEYTIDANHTVINENILLGADKIGVQHFRITLSAIEGEISTVNNVKDIYIEVLDGRQNILILANAPHPDIKALKLSIESNENYKVTTQFFNDFDGNVEPYSLLIVHQLPNSTPEYVKTLSRGNISMLFILGNQTSVHKFNNYNVGLSIANSRNKYNLLLPNVINNFPLFTLSEETMKAINLFPPLLGPFGDYQLTTNGYPLLNQKIGNVATEQPLMVFFQNETKKVAVISGEGIWKWRMQDFLKTNNHNAFNELINKTVQFLSVKEDKSKFRVITQDIFLENEEIILNAELYNDSYELINEPEITIDLIDGDAHKFSFVFNKTSTAYLLNAGLLPAGFYSYTAKVKWGTKKYTEYGKFQITPILLEANSTVANHQLLQNISEKHGGELLFPSAINQLAKKLKGNNDITPIIYEEEDLKELINLKWIFFLLLTLLSVEWFLRKRNGAY
jgi:hypothetical protein